MERLARSSEGWPEAVKAGPSAPRVRDVILPGEGWTLAGEGYAGARGSACNAGGEVYFADMQARKVYRIGLDGKASVFLAKADPFNAIAVGPKGEVYTVSENTREVMRYDSDLSRHAMTRDIPGRYVLARPDGALYVTGQAQGYDNRSQIWLIKDGRADGGRYGAQTCNRLGISPRSMVAFRCRRRLEVGL